MSSAEKMYHSTLSSKHGAGAWSPSRIRQTFQYAFSSQQRPEIHEVPGVRSNHQNIPIDAWDSHMHVIDPTKYPVIKNAQYHPSVFTVFAAQRFEQSIGFQNVVLVQPSIYGTDNSCLFDALQQLGPDRARAVVAFDPSTTSIDQLRQWHALGVRGVRINLKSIEETPDETVFMQELQKYADLIRPLKWVLDLHVAMSTLPLIEKLMPSLDVKICLDHFGCPSLATTESEVHAPPKLDGIEGFESLLRLVKAGQTWVKISAAYRLAMSISQKEMLKAMAIELIRVAPGRLLWASDWPHTRHEGLDIRSFLTDCIELCGSNVDMGNRLFRDNAIDLWS